MEKKEKIIKAFKTVLKSCDSFDRIDIVLDGSGRGIKTHIKLDGFEIIHNSGGYKTVSLGHISFKELDSRINDTDFADIYNAANEKYTLLKSLEKEKNNSELEKILEG